MKKNEGEKQPDLLSAVTLQLVQTLIFFVQPKHSDSDGQ